MSRVVQKETFAQSIGMDVQTVGSVSYGTKNGYGYIMSRGAIYDVMCPSELALPSVSASELQSVSGIPCSGTTDLGAVFQSESQTFRAVVSDPRTLYVVSQSDVLPAAQQFAAALSIVQDGYDAAVSISASVQYIKYVGRPIDLDDAHDSMDVGLDPNDMISIQLVKGDEYRLLIKDAPDETFYLRGHKLVQNILSQCQMKDALGIVSMNNRAIFAYAGTTKQDITRPIRIKEGTDIYELKSEFYFSYNLNVPLSKLAPASSIPRLLERCKQVAGKKSIVNGKYGTDAGKPNAAPAPAKKAEVWGAAVPVTANQPHRSRIFFATTKEDLALRVQEHVQNLRVPVDYYLFRSNTADPLYADVMTGRVIIKHTDLVARQYKAIKVNSPIAVSEIITTEPRDNPPPLDLAGIPSNAAQNLIKIRSLIDQGFFITGIRMGVRQDSSGIIFEAPFIDDRRYNMVVGAARRISVWLKQQGVPVSTNTVSLERGQTKVRIRLKFSEPRDPKSVEKLRDDAPTLNAPIYENTERAEPTVEITEFNIHTGMVIARMQRGPKLYAAPYTERYANIRRRTL